MTGVTWNDTRSDPASGVAYYDLVRGQNVRGSGTHGFVTGGAERVARHRP